MRLPSPAIVLLLAGAGCLGGGEADSQPKPGGDAAAPPLASSNGPTDGTGSDATGVPVRVEGRLATGVGCATLRTSDGRSYAVDLERRPVDDGAYVRVTGTPGASCPGGGGEALRATEIRTIEPPVRDRDPARAGGLAITSDYVKGGGW